MESNKLIEVRYKNTWLTPCLPKRARKLVSIHRASWFRHPEKGYCIRLKSSIGFNCVNESGNTED
jgi:hypothetical protein